MLLQRSSILFMSVVVAASWWRHSGWAGICYNVKL